MAEVTELTNVQGKKLNFSRLKFDLQLMQKRGDHDATELLNMMKVHWDSLQTELRGLSASE